MKKIVALVLAMVLGISMIGCSSNNSVKYTQIGQD